MADPAPPDWAAPLGRVPSGLFILTAVHGPHETGMLVSWVQQCSFDPPRVSVALKPERQVSAWMRDGAAFTLNLIADDRKLLGHFARGFDVGEPAFTGLSVERAAGEGPVLNDALGHLLCRVASRVSAGDHDLILATVVGGRMHQPDGKPATHVRKSGQRY